MIEECQNYGKFTEIINSIFGHIDLRYGAAIQVAEDALLPIPNGFLLFFDREKNTIPDNIAGSLCIAALYDHALPVLRRIEKGSVKGLLNLFNPRTVEFINSKLKWASKIKIIAPNSGQEKI